MIASNSKNHKNNNNESIKKEKIGLIYRMLQKKKRYEERGGNINIKKRDSIFNKNG